MDREFSTGARMLARPAEQLSIFSERALLLPSAFSMRVARAHPESYTVSEGS